MLKIEDLTVRYGAVTALENVSVEVPEGSVVAILGANGAGKTSLLRTISGLTKPASGSIVFEGKDVSGLSPEAMVRNGVSHVPENRRVLAQLSVYENMVVATTPWRRGNKVDDDLEAMFELFPILRERRDQMAGHMSGGEQQMLAIARGLLARPRVMLLDEPSLGLAPRIVDTIFEVFAKIADDGLTLLLVEQNVSRALAVASHAYILERGRVVLSGPADQVKDDPAMIAAYFGATEDEVSTRKES